MNELVDFMADRKAADADHQFRNTKRLRQRIAGTGIKRIHLLFFSLRDDKARAMRQTAYSFPRPDTVRPSRPDRTRCAGKAGIGSASQVAHSCRCANDSGPRLDPGKQIVDASIKTHPAVDASQIDAPKKFKNDKLFAVCRTRRGGPPDAKRCSFLLRTFSGA